MATVYSMTLQLAGLASDEPTTSHLHPGDAMVLSLINKAKQLAVIFAPFSMNEMTAYGNAVSFPSGIITGKIVGYYGAIDLTGTPHPLETSSGANTVYLRPTEAGYAWWHVKKTAGIHTYQWSGNGNTSAAVAAMIAEPVDVDLLEDVGVGVTGWIYTFAATFAAMSICIWNRNLQQAKVLAGMLSKMIEAGMRPSLDMQGMQPRMEVKGQPRPLV